MSEEDVFSSPIVEEQMILRLPHDLAKQVRKLLKNKSNLPLQFRMDTDRKGKFYFDEKEYDLTIANLQSILESHKTLDKRNFYKISDIGQIMMVEDPNLKTDLKTNDPKVDYTTFDLDSGITPPTRHIRKRKWRKKPTYTRMDVSLAEEELHKITKGLDPSESMEFVSPEEIIREREQKNNPRLDASSSSVTSVGLKVKVNLKRSSASIQKPMKSDEDTLSSDDEK